MKIRNGRNIKTGEKPYIVAELNSSHRGKVDIAKEMIRMAKDCGCDAVKFQSWSTDSLYCSDYYDKNPMSKRMVKGFSLNPESLLELCEYCHEVGIDFSSTPYSEEEVDFLIEKCNAPFIKVASMDINNLLFLRYIAIKKVPIVLSTGMATMREIETAVLTIEEAGNSDICILHCVSLYPVEPQNVNLNNMITLRKKFPQYEVGYSDHTIGSEVSCAAVALGASLIEKHFTLDNKKIGWDNQMATEPSNMKELVEKCHQVYASLGSYERILTKEDLEQRSKMRRSIVSNTDLKAGQIIKEGDIIGKRPGDGIAIDEYHTIIGQIVDKDIPKDRLILRESLRERNTE